MDNIVKSKLEALDNWSKKFDLRLTSSSLSPRKSDEKILQTAWLSYKAGHRAYQIPYIPDEIDVLQHITRFEFIGVGLKSLPDTLNNISSIKDLYLENNKLIKLPSIDKLVNLSYLNLSHNNIIKLSKDIAHLENLIMIDISHNHISALPKVFSNLQKLDRLFLANNPIGELPESLQECKKLEHIDISNTNIKRLPKWLENMPNLRRIDGAKGLKLHFQTQLHSEYKNMQLKFRECFNQDLSNQDCENKKSGIIGDEAMPLGKYIWDKSSNCIEYYVSWLPHYRGDSHGKIYKNGTHEHLPTLPQFGEVTQWELDLKEELRQKGLFDIW